MKQTVTVLGINLGRLINRPGLALVNVIGIASAVAVMTSLLTVSAGIVRMAETNADPSRAIVLSVSASGVETLGAIPANSVPLIAEAPGIRRDATGQPMVQPLALVSVDMTKQGSEEFTVPFRGTGPVGWAMNPSMHLTAGRMYRPGLRELLVGKGIQHQFDNPLDVGDKVVLRGGEWTVVGSFADGGGLSENVFMSDVTTVLTAFDRNSYQSVGVLLESPDKFDEFKQSLESNPQLSVSVQRYSDYYKNQTKPVTMLLNFIAYFIGAVYALGVVFGAVTTMYAAVDTRTRVYGTLRAIGFSGSSILFSVLIESLIVALPGLVLGTLLAWLALSGHRASVREISFILAFTPGLVISASVLTAVIGLLGGLAPAIRAARLPVAVALRAT